MQSKKIFFNFMGQISKVHFYWIMSRTDFSYHWYQPVPKATRASGLVVHSHTGGVPCMPYKNNFFCGIPGIKKVGLEDILIPSALKPSISQLAFESLAVIGNALTLLEVGQIAVCR